MFVRRLGSRKDLLKTADILFMLIRFVHTQMGFENEINQDYLNNLYLLNVWHTYKTQQQNFEGKILGVSKEGRLIIQSKDGNNHEFSFKEVEF